MVSGKSSMTALDELSMHIDLKTPKQQTHILVGICVDHFMEKGSMLYATLRKMNTGTEGT